MSESPEKKNQIEIPEVSDPKQHHDAEQTRSAREQYELLQKESKALKKKMLKAGIVLLAALAFIFCVVLLMDYINRPTSEIPDDLYKFDPPYQTLDEAKKMQYQSEYNNLAEEKHIIEYYHYGNPEKDGYREGITAENRDRMDVGVLFLCDWLDTVKNGDADGYNSYFSEAYWEENKPEGVLKKDFFSPQMIYDINIAPISKTTDQGDQLYTYWVEYKILHNDGTFRRDIGSNMCRRQDITVRVRNDGTAIIEKLVTVYGLREDIVIETWHVLVVLGVVGIGVVAYFVVKKKRKVKTNV